MMSITNKLFIAVILIVLSAFFAMATITTYFVQKSAVEQAYLLLEVSNRKIDDKISRFFVNRKNEVFWLSEIVDAHFLTMNKALYKSEEFFKVASLFSNNFKKIIIIDKNGMEVIKIVDKEMVSNLKDQSSSEIFKKGKVSNYFTQYQHVMHDLKRFPEEVYVKQILNNEGQFNGLVLAYLNFDALNSVVGDLSFGNRGYSFILDGDGNYIFHPRKKYFLYVEDQKEFIPKEIKDIVNVVKNDKQLSMETVLDGSRSLVSSQVLKELDWHVISAVPRRFIDEALYKLVGVLFYICFFVLLIGFIVIYLVAVGITRPLGLLMRSIEKIISGDLTQRVVINRKDELGDLAELFEKMRGVLQGLIFNRDCEINRHKLAKLALEKAHDQRLLLNQLMELSLKVKSLDEHLQGYVNMIVNSGLFSEDLRSAIFLVDPNDSLNLVMKAQTGLSLDHVEKCANVHFKDCVCGRSAELEKVIFVAGLDEGDTDNRFRTCYSDHGHYCVPIVAASDKLFGLLNVFVSYGVKYDPDLETLLLAIAKIIAASIEKNSVENELEHANIELKNQQQSLQNTLKDLIKANDELKRTQTQLIQTEKLASIGNLSSGVAHEIQNPANFIKNNLKLLNQYSVKLEGFLLLFKQFKEAYLLNDQEKISALITQIDEYIHDIKLDAIQGEIWSLVSDSLGGADKIIKIASELAAFARKASEDALQMVQVEEVLDGILNSVVFKSYQDRIIFKIVYTSTPVVKCDRSRISRAFENVMLNAIQAIESNGIVEVGTSVTDEWVVVCLKDTGVGISDENLKKIFDPYYSLKPLDSGAGLGLSISYDIIKSSGGDVKIESMLGVGTTVSVYLPIFKDKNKDLV